MATQRPFAIISSHSQIQTPVSGLCKRTASSLGAVRARSPCHSAKRRWGSNRQPSRCKPSRCYLLIHCCLLSNDLAVSRSTDQQSIRGLVCAAATLHVACLKGFRAGVWTCSSQTKPRGTRGRKVTALPPKRLTSGLHTAQHSTPTGTFLWSSSLTPY